MNKRWRQFIFIILIPGSNKHHKSDSGNWLRVRMSSLRPPSIHKWWLGDFQSEYIIMDSYRLGAWREVVKLNLFRDNGIDDDLFSGYVRRVVTLIRRIELCECKSMIKLYNLFLNLPDLKMIVFYMRKIGKMIPWYKPKL